MSSPQSKTLAVLFIEYFKDAVLAYSYSFPVSIKWAVGSEEERRARRAKPRVKDCVWAVLSGPDRHGPDRQREALQAMAAEWVTKLAYPGEMEFKFDVDCSWFEVLDDPNAETVTLRVVNRKD